ncbi:MAG: hypothetical protein IT307_19235 [Chloroflexi bacterium]|nr:hypothetical protein [Chloroflexota bacterium]
MAGIGFKVVRFASVEGAARREDHSPEPVTRLLVDREWDRTVNTVWYTR